MLFFHDIYQNFYQNIFTFLELKSNTDKKILKNDKQCEILFENNIKSIILYHFTSKFKRFYERKIDTQFIKEPLYHSSLKHN